MEVWRDRERERERERGGGLRDGETDIYIEREVEKRTRYRGKRE